MGRRVPSFHRPPTYHQSAFTAMDDSTDGCSRILQIFLLVVTAVAMVFSVSAVLNCEYLFFHMPNLTLQQNSNNTLELASDGQTRISFGLFKFQDPFNPNQCFVYEEEADKTNLIPQDIPLQAQIARWSMACSSLLTIWALFLLSLEICCCRFICSRVLINLAYIAALLGIPPTFLLYTGGVCNAFSKSSYACDLGQGAIQALVAAGLLLLCLILSCVTPKSVPLVRVIQEREQRMVHDPCCCCPGKSKKELLRQDPNLLLASMPPDHVEIAKGTEKGGGTATTKTYTYKHYFDDQAGGVTLQSQYIAASQRWLECERNYSEALDRFKQECQEYKEASNNPHSWRYLLQLPVGEVKDPELARQRLVLDTLKHECDQARRVMDLIEADLEAHIKPADEKIEEALRGIDQEESAPLMLVQTDSGGESAEDGDNAGVIPVKDEEPNSEEVAVVDEEIGEPIEASFVANFDDTMVVQDDSVNYANDACPRSFTVTENNNFQSALMVIDDESNNDKGEEEPIKEGDNDEGRSQVGKSWLESMFYSTATSEGVEQYEKKHT